VYLAPDLPLPESTRSKRKGKSVKISRRRPSQTSKKKGEESLYDESRRLKEGDKSWDSLRRQTQEKRKAKRGGGKRPLPPNKKTKMFYFQLPNETEKESEKEISPKTEKGTRGRGAALLKKKRKR